MTSSCSHFLLRFLIHATAERCQLNWWRDGRLRQWSRLVKFRPLQRRSNSFDAGRRVARDYSRVCGCAPGRIWCRQPDLRNTSKYIAGIDTKREANSSWTYDCLICLHWPYIWTKLFSFFLMDLWLGLIFSFLFMSFFNTQPLWAQLASVTSFFTHIHFTYGTFDVKYGFCYVVRYPFSLRLRFL